MGDCDCDIPLLRGENVKRSQDSSTQELWNRFERSPVLTLAMGEVAPPSPDALPYLALLKYLFESLIRFRSLTPAMVGGRWIGPWAFNLTSAPVCAKQVSAGVQSVPMAGPSWRGGGR